MVQKYKSFFRYPKKVFELFPLKKKYLLFLFISMFFVSIIELFGISLIIPFITSLLNFNQSELSKMPKIDFLDRFNFYEFDTILIAIFIIIAFSIKLLLSVIVEAIILKLSLKSRALLRHKMTELFLDAGYKNFLKSNSSKQINLIQSYCAQHKGAVLHFMKLFGDLIFLTFIIIFLTARYSFYAIISFFLISFVIFFFDKFTKKKIFSIGKEINELNAQVIKILSEAIYGFKEIKIYNLNNYFSNKIKKVSLQHAKIDTIFELLSKLPRFLFEYIIIISFASFGIFLAHTDININQILPDISVLFILVLRLIPLGTSLTTNISKLRHCKDGVDKLYDNYKLLSEDNSIFNYEIEIDYGKTFQSLELRDVSFKYPNSSIILNKVNLKIKKGDFVGIVGQSGSGKTTIIDIFLGLLQPSEGEMFLNDKKFDFKRGIINEFSSYIPQDNFIFDDDLISNITFKKEENLADFSKFKDVTKKTKIDDLINNLPNSYNTKLGEHGKFLSGGQKQRIAISRAIYFEKDILILDESTNALDVNLENEILEFIEELNKKFNITIIMITHNKKNLGLCSKIFEINNGKITEES